MDFGLGRVLPESEAGFFPVAIYVLPFLFLSGLTRYAYKVFLCRNAWLLTRLYGFPGFKHRYHVAHFPKTLRYASRHRRRHAKRLMRPNEIVVEKVQRHRVSMVRQLL